MPHASTLLPGAPSNTATTATTITRSVFFTDVVCSTQILDDRGELAWLALVERHADRISVVAGRHGGHVSSFLGDGFMVVFDDPSEALAAAIELQIESVHEGFPGIRIGLDHGNVHRFRRDWWVGRTIHLASRLTDLCGSGEVVVSDRCFQPARRDLALPAYDSRLVAVRGFSDPWLVHVFVQPSDKPTARSTP